jgi:predicted  nucleic acid-binding Zn-ribbon protein
MPVKSVLIALEEQKKWKRRRAYLQSKLERVRKRRQGVLLELERVNRKLARFDKRMASLKEAAVPREISTVRIESMR